MDRFVLLFSAVTAQAFSTFSYSVVRVFCVHLEAIFTYFGYLVCWSHLWQTCSSDDGWNFHFWFILRLHVPNFNVVKHIKCFPRVAARTHHSTHAPRTHAVVCVSSQVFKDLFPRGEWILCLLRYILSCCQGPTLFCRIFYFIMLLFTFPFS